MNELIDHETGEILTIDPPEIGEAIVAVAKTFEGIPASETFQLSPAEQNDITTRGLIKEIEKRFVAVGFMLMINKEQGYWNSTGYETFRDYCESLNIGSYSTAMRLIAVADMVKQKMVTEADVYEIGMSKMNYLIKYSKTNILEDELLELAKTGTVTALRAELGYTVGVNDESCHINCPRCGETIKGAKYAKVKEIKDDGFDS